MKKLLTREPRAFTLLEVALVVAIIGMMLMIIVGYLLAPKQSGPLPPIPEPTPFPFQRFAPVSLATPAPAAAAAPSTPPAATIAPAAPAPASATPAATPAQTIELSPQSSNPLPLTTAVAEITAQSKFSCPACGAEAQWNAAKQALVCPFCGTVSPMKAPPEGGAIVEHDLAEALRSIPDDQRGWQTEKKSVKCQSCQAITVFDPTHVA